ncbi:hypothetical protein HDE69_005201 [Pedobacter cryoconitis]|uniref:DUF4160 domain-containing protein n=1 Tax=Pedobacter cryoconitis TaxID=188932 RepID=A0A7W8YYD6_9SPHI|nr:hypothetical protein [Pedobacter cryoconitis]MBB5624104.1 hypothetical protein [Pedobacter cryoconitis]
MQVLSTDKFTVHIFTDHPPPHCHVRFMDGEEILVTVPSFKKIAGEKTLTKEIKDCLLDNIDYICMKMDEFNNN